MLRLTPVKYALNGRKCPKAVYSLIIDRCVSADKAWGFGKSEKQNRDGGTAIKRPSQMLRRAFRRGRWAPLFCTHHETFLLPCCCHLPHRGPEPATWNFSYDGRLISKEGIPGILSWRFGEWHRSGCWSLSGVWPWSQLSMVWSVLQWWKAVGTALYPLFLLPVGAASATHVLMTEWLFLVWKVKSESDVWRVWCFATHGL